MSSYIWAGVAIAAGAILTVYCISTAVDPYWTPPVRMSAIVGAGLGFAVTLTGIWSLFL